MCNFVSGWVTETGTIYNATEFTDSHGDVSRIYGLRDTEATYYA